LLAAAALILGGGRRTETPEFELRWAAAFMASYALFSGAVVAPAPFFPATVLSTKVFLAWVGIPVQVFRALCAIGVAFFIWRHARREYSVDRPQAALRFGMSGAEWTIFLLLMGIVGVGYHFTNMMGREADRREREILIGQARLAAGALNMAAVRELNARESDTILPAYAAVKRQLAGIRAADAHFRFAYLMILRDGQVLFLADSEPDTSPDSSPPGQVFTEIGPGPVEVLRGLPEIAEGPSEDRWGTWVSAYAVAPEPGSGGTRVVIGIDVDARTWGTIIGMSRLPAILITMLISVIVIIYHVARERDEAGKAALVRFERLAAVGSMSTGIAHEFNNALLVIRSHIEILLRGEQEAETRRRLEVVERQAGRASEIVRGVSTLARPIPIQLESVAIAAVVQEVLEAQGELLAAESIEVEYHPASDRWLADRNAVLQVLSNIVTNARHAMMPHGRGRLQFVVSREAGQVRLSVSDDGIGMSNETLGQIFTPFFTTKGGRARDKLGIQGVGLGLAVSLRLIQAQKGKLLIESTYGQGTTFSILLPSDA
jgi:signal transduction histidine kinase